jgi:hypothetical protein
MATQSVADAVERGPVSRRRRRRWSEGVTLVAAVGAGVAAATGLLVGPDPTPFATVHGQEVDLFGAGAYAHDSLFAGAGNRGTDLVTLVLVLPVLLVALVGQRRGALRATLLLTGAQAWLLYVYATMAVGAAYGPFFLLHVLLLTTSLWALVLTSAALDVDRLDAAVPYLPRLGPAVLMLVSGAVTAVVWLGPVAAAQLAGSVPDRLDHYTTLVTVALDAAVITPAAVVAGLLVLRGSATGYRIAVPLLVVEALLAPLIAAQTASQLSAGVVLSPPEVVGPLAGFVALSSAAALVLWRVLSALPGRSGLAGA